jgi:hypothetical protein
MDGLPNGELPVRFMSKFSNISTPGDCRVAVARDYFFVTVTGSPLMCTGSSSRVGDLGFEPV